MINSSRLAMCLIVLASGAVAQGTFVPPPASTGGPALTPLQASVADSLRHYGLNGIDVRELSTGQLAAIHHLVHSDRTSGDIRGLVRSAAGQGIFSRYFKK